MRNFARIWQRTILHALNRDLLEERQTTVTAEINPKLPDTVEELNRMEVVLFCVAFTAPTVALAAIISTIRDTVDEPFDRTVPYILERGMTKPMIKLELITDQNDLWQTISTGSSETRKIPDLSKRNQADSEQ